MKNSTSLLILLVIAIVAISELIKLCYALHFAVVPLLMVLVSVYLIVTIFKEL